MPGLIIPQPIIPPLKTITGLLRFWKSWRDTKDLVKRLMRERNPINFTDRVTAPVMFIIGENDSRCPFRQAMAYVDRLKDRGHPHEVYLFGTGHSSFDIEEEIHQQRAILAFLARTVPTA